ncbi:uncharacterized protein LOC131155406 [Malania oleifera]|uniref:uncharacterized protein LOC131155406 n=1 Tax=Malania oleifera TaxID=397392 RepID=UPI0025AE7C71|nr:uncharacterized protein LOC131155406 [Malania oleifera]
MKPSSPLFSKPAKSAFIRSFRWTPNAKRPYNFRLSGVKFPATIITGRRPKIAPTTLWAAYAASSSASPVIESDMGRVVSSNSPQPAGKLEAIEEGIEKVVYRCRFLTLLAVWGSLLASFLCFIKGCTFVVSAFMDYFVNRGKVIMLLVEAIDVYLLGTVMLVFGMGLYELFVSNLDIVKSLSEENFPQRSSLFGLFALKERPQWLEIKSVNELKTKLGHVIVMLLLIGFLDKSKKAVIHSPVDLLCFSASILLSSGCLYLLSKLADPK